MEDYTVLYNTADEINAKRILEIGTNQGVSAITLATIAKKNGGGVQCIDCEIQPDLINNLKFYNVYPYVQILHKPSPWVNPCLINYPLDYLYIDANHHMRWAIVDYHYFYIFVRPGGRIAFHDTCTSNQEVTPAIDWILQTDAELGLKEIANIRGDNGIMVFEKNYDHSELVAEIIKGY
jgi:predicted O-methyltransferase YrrM